jgi:hypothetical protein
MEDLIEALTIFLKYANNSRNPVCCIHDQFIICCDITLDKVSESDITRLQALGFFWSEYHESFTSFRFGSC